MKGKAVQNKFPSIIRRRMFYSTAAATLLVMFAVWSSWRLWQTTEDEHAYIEEVLYPSQRHLLSMSRLVERTNQATLFRILFDDEKYELEHSRLWKYEIQPLMDSLQAQERNWHSVDDRTLLQDITISLQKLYIQQFAFIKKYKIDKAFKSEQEMYEQALEEIKREGATPSLFNTPVVKDSLDKVAVKDSLLEELPEGFPSDGEESSLLDAPIETGTSNPLLQEYQRRVAPIADKVQTETARLLLNFDGQLRLSRELVARNRLLMIIEGVVVLIFLFVLMLLGSRWAYMRLSSGLRRLHHFFTELAQTNVPATVPVSQDELGRLCVDGGQIRENMQIIRNFAEEVAKGHLEAELEGLPEGEVAVSLKKMRQALIEVAQQERERSWITEGLNLFADILRRTDDVQAMYDELMRELVRYVGAQQAALFVLKTEEDEEAHLELTSFYAFDRKRLMKKEISKGEGLVGQCWVEGNTIYLLKVPEQYVEISGGMGSEKPRSLLIVPLKAREQTLGVLELASFHPMGEKERRFVEELASDIGSTLFSLQSAEQTRRLLEESRLITEQMRLQEEELQKEINRLVGEVRQLKYESKEYRSLLDVIREKAIVMEFDSNGNFIYVNDRFCEITGFEKEELLGKSRVIYAPADADPAEFNLLWSQLSSGVYLEKELKRSRKDGTPFWLRAQLFPIHDEKGEFKKVLCIATDITGKVQSTQRMMRSQQELSAKQLAFERACISIETDKHFHILDINEYACRLLGIEREQALHAHIDELVLGRLDFDDLLRRLEQDEVVSGDVLMAAQDFQYKYVRLTAVAARNINQEIEHVFFIGLDLSADKHREIDLQAKVEALEKKVYRLERNIEELKQL
jgi:PAS domain S-box-containing protein